jgi:hypothetical protein
MPPTKYKIWQWGGLVGEGATQSEYVGLAGGASTRRPTKRSGDRRWQSFKAAAIRLG